MGIFPSPSISPALRGSTSGAVSLPLIGLVWLGVVLSGTALMIEYSGSPAKTESPPTRWPASARWKERPRLTCASDTPARRRLRMQKPSPSCSTTSGRPDRHRPEGEGAERASAMRSERRRCCRPSPLEPRPPARRDWSGATCRRRRTPRSSRSTPTTGSEPSGTGRTSSTSARC